jgi:hypothetical protein
MTNHIIAEIKNRNVPRLYAGENDPDPQVYLELNLLGFSWRWFVTECQFEDDGDVLFFGYVSGDFGEWGYFRLSELANQTLPLFIPEEFKPARFSEVKKEYDL